MLSPVKRIKLLWTLFAVWIDELWGWDFFISYAWGPNQRYALALKAALKDGEPSFDAFVDIFGLDGREALKAAIRRHLHKSSALIVVGSERALHPLREKIKDEIDYFVDVGRPIYTIRFGTIELPEELRERPWLTEDEKALEPAGPIVRELKEKFRGIRQRAHRNRVLIVSALSVSLFLFLLGAGFLIVGLRALNLAQRIRVEAIARTASSARDPLVGNLLLTEIANEDPPNGAIPLARQIARTPVPSAVLRGNKSEVTALEFDGSGKHVLTGSRDGSIRLYPADGRGDPIDIKVGLSAIKQCFFIRDSAQIAVCDGASLQILSLPGGAVSDQIPATAIAPAATIDRVWIRDRGAWVVLAAGTNGLFARQLGGAGTLKRLVDKSIYSAWLGLPDDANAGRQELRVALPDGTCLRFELTPGKDSAPVARKPLPLQTDEILEGRGSEEFGFSPAGDKIASIRNAPDAVIYSIDPAKKPLILHHPDKQKIDAFRFSAGGRMMLTRSKSGLVYVWSAETGQPIHEPLDVRVQIWSFDDLFFGRPSNIDEQGSPPELKDALFSPDENWIATRTVERSLRLWHLHDAAPPRELRAHFGCDHIVFSGDGGQVAAADGDEVRVWSMQRPDEPLTFTQPDRVLAAAVPADRSFVLTRGGDGIARIWPLGPGRTRQELKPGSSKTIESIDCDNDASAVAVAYANGEIRLWRPGAPDPFRIFSEHIAGKSGYMHVRFAPDHRRVVSWTDQSAARVWRRDGAGQTVVIRPGSPILDATFDPVAQVIVTGHVDSRLRGWDAKTGRLLFELTSGKQPESMMIIRISRDGRWILAGSSDGTARVWKFERSCAPMVFPLAPYAAELGGRTLWVSSAEFSPDSSSVGICTMNGQVRVVNLATGRSRVLQSESLRTAIGATADVGPIAYMAFSPDGRFLATCSAMLGWVQVWPLAGEQTPIRIQGIGSALFAEFTVDGSRIITANEGGAVQVWRTGWNELTEHLRSRTTAVLLTDQRMQLLGEDASTARKAYEAGERRYGRTPRPNTSDFIYVELDR